MNKLLDTDVFIDYYRGLPQAKKYFQEKTKAICSVITIAELMRGAHNKQEQTNISHLLTRIQALPLSATTGEKMLFLMKKYSLSHGLSIADALIAATASENKLTLVTANTKHFSFIKSLKLLDWKKHQPKISTSKIIKS